MKELFPICTLTWTVNNYVSRQGKAIKRIQKNMHTNTFSTDVNNQQFRENDYNFPKLTLKLKS